MWKPISKGEFPGDFEQLVMLALVRLRDDAYGMRVRRELEDRAARDVSIGAVYATLDRLESKGLVVSATGEPTPERGGRARRIFRVTPDGAEALRRSRMALKQMWAGPSDLRSVTVAAR